MIKSIYIWGTGIIAEHFYNNICEVLEIEGFLESFPQKNTFLQKNVCTPVELLDKSIVFVANTHYKEICNQFGEMLKRKEVRLIDTFSNEKVYLKKEGWNYSIVDSSDIWLDFNSTRVITNNEDLFHRFKINRPESFWEDKSENSALGEVNYTSKRRLLEEWIVPQLSKEQDILDIGCSNGVFDEYLSSYAECIDAYDYSNLSIKGAKESARRKGISNINYYCADMKTLDLQKEYNIIITLGTLCFCESKEQMRNVIQKLCNALKTQGSLLIINTITDADDPCTYFYCFDNNYHAYYYRKDVVPSICREFGLELKRERIVFDDYVGNIYKPIMGWEFVKMN